MSADPRDLYPGGDPENLVTVTLTVCLACRDDDHQTCYGTGCECGCQGEFV